HRVGEAVGVLGVVSALGRIGIAMAGRLIDEAGCGPLAIDDLHLPGDVGLGHLNLAGADDRRALPLDLEYTKTRSLGPQLAAGVPQTLRLSRRRGGGDRRPKLPIGLGPEEKVLTAAEPRDADRRIDLIRFGHGKLLMGWPAKIGRGAPEGLHCAVRAQ